MGKITIQIPEYLDQKLREYLIEIYGGERGYLGAFIIDAIREKLEKIRSSTQTAKGGETE